MRGVKHDELDFPDSPKRWGLSLRAASDIADFSYFELKSYCEMTDTNLSAVEVDVIKDLSLVRNMIQSNMTPQKVLEAFGYGQVTNRS